MKLIITDSVKNEVNNFKAKVLPLINKINIDFEIGYCLRRLNECYDDIHLYTYYNMCICFLRGQKHYLQAK
jgi:hypothetical protein